MRHRESYCANFCHQRCLPCFIRSSEDQYGVQQGRGQLQRLSSTEAGIRLLDDAISVEEGGCRKFLVQLQLERACRGKMSLLTHTCSL